MTKEDFDPLAFTTAVNTLAVAIAQNLSEDELALLTAALEEYQKQPMLMIVCGAQGSDEPRAEGDVMRDWLIEHGVAASDIEAETGSFNTRQNLGYAQSIMDDRGLTGALIVTSDYHVPRALALCKQVGIIACGKGSPSKPEYFIKNHLREGLSWIKFMWESRYE